MRSLRNHEKGFKRGRAETGPVSGHSHAIFESKPNAYPVESMVIGAMVIICSIQPVERVGSYV